MNNFYFLSKVRLSLLFTLLFCTTNFLFAQFQWTGNSDTNWENPNNWSPVGVPSTGSSVFVPAAPIGGNFPTIQNDLTLDYVVQNLGIITVDAVVTNTSTFINFNGGDIVIDVNGQFLNNGTVTFDNDGDLTNRGIIDNNGVLDNAGSAILLNETGAELNNNAGGEIRNFGAIDNQGTVWNGGSITNTTLFDNSGTLINNDRVLNEITAIFNNLPTGLIQNNQTFEAGGTLHNEGSIVNSASFIINSSGTMTNDGSFENHQNMDNSGIINNNNYLLNVGILNNHFGAIINNYGHLDNTGTLEILDCSILFQFSNILISGDVWNLGIIYELGAPVNSMEMGGIKLFDINDSPEPVAICKDATLQLNEEGIAELSPADIDNGSIATYCGIAEMMASPSIFDCEDVGENTATLTVIDGLSNIGTCEATVTILTSEACDVINPNQEFCTLTQGFYGNPGGIQFGMTTLEVIEAALSDGPIVIGSAGQSLIIMPGSSQCIIDLLPGGGPSSELPSADVTLSNGNCDPAPIPTKHGRFKNTLLAQTITLSLNTRNDSDLEFLPLQNACISVPSTINNALPTNATVGDLLNYANAALGGGGGNLGLLADVLGDINDYFDECNLACFEGGGSGAFVVPEISYFDARQQSVEVKVEWHTNTSFKNEKFVVERSKDGQNFEPIHTENNNAEGHQLESYQTKDGTPNKGKNYYRLKKIFKDGTTEYSDIKLVVFGNDPTQMEVYPNPAQETLWLNTKALIGKNIEIQIFNNVGVQIFQQNLEATSEQVELNLSNYDNGLYMIVIATEGQKKVVKRFVVSRLY